MTDNRPKCPFCEIDLEAGFLYTRGIGSALFWSHQGDTGMWSRKQLQQINLDQISITGTGGQAVIKAWLCPQCDLVCFRRSR